MSDEKFTLNPAPSFMDIVELSPTERSEMERIAKELEGLAGTLRNRLLETPAPSVPHHFALAHVDVRMVEIKRRVA